MRLRFSARKYYGDLLGNSILRRVRRSLFASWVGARWSRSLMRGVTCTSRERQVTQLSLSFAYKKSLKHNARFRWLSICERSYLAQLVALGATLS
jgi:hypothetical protein